VIGQLSSYVLTFPLEMNLKGIWLGMMIGACGYDLLQVLNLLRSNWEKLVDEIEVHIVLRKGQIPHLVVRIET
jgi:hypothetical protein